MTTVPAAVFLDKDGTLVVNEPYNADPDRMRLLPGAGEAAARLCAAGWKLVVVTNQSGVARGLFPESQLALVEDRLRELLKPFGAELAGFRYCPHLPEAPMKKYAVECQCRKPAPGLILSACRELGLNPESCWMVGDASSDEVAGRRAGCRTIRLDPDSPRAWGTAVECILKGGAQGEFAFSDGSTIS